MLIARLYEIKYFVKTLDRVQKQTRRNLVFASFFFLFALFLGFSSSLIAYHFLEKVIKQLKEL